MRPRALAAAAALVALVALARERGPAADAPRARPRPPASALAEEGPPQVDPTSLRDVFRFADTASPPPERPRVDLVEGRRPAAVESGTPRLVGLVRCGELIRAAFAVDGEVLLVGPGETAGGLTVIAVEEEGVRVRREDGREETLPLG